MKKPSNLLLLMGCIVAAWINGWMASQSYHEETVKELKRRTTCSGSKPKVVSSGIYEGYFVEPAVPRPQTTERRIQELIEGK